MINKIYFSLIIGILAGCQNDLSNLKNASMVTGMIHKNNLEAPFVEVYNPITKENPFPALFVQHKTKGNHVLVECIVSGITFRKGDDTNQKVGKMIVWIDGQRNIEVDSAAFIIKNLKPGSHLIKLELVGLNNVPYGLEKEFMVNITK